MGMLFLLLFSPGFAGSMVVRGSIFLNYPFLLLMMPLRGHGSLLSGHGSLEILSLKINKEERKRHDD
jgi:hypothetical protein